MNFPFQQGLKRAALFFKEGNHQGAESIIRELQAINDPLSIECIINLIKSEIQVFDIEAAYFHFAAFKLLGFYLTKNKDNWFDNKKNLLIFFFDYAKLSGERILSPMWRSVLSESALNTAIVLKLSCADTKDGIDTKYLSDIVTELLSILEAHRSESEMVFIGHVILNIIEEFGIYHKSSRGRGMPLRFHRACRIAFESYPLAQILKSLLYSAECSIMKTFQTVEVIITCLDSLLSWSTHSFFEEDASDNEYNHSFKVSGNLWRTLLLEGVSFPNNVVKINVLLHKWYSNGGICGFPLNRRSIIELIRQFSRVKMEIWNFSDKLNYGTNFLSLVCYVVRDILGSNLQDDEVRATLPLAVSGIGRILENFSEIFEVGDFLDSYILEISEFTKKLIELDSQLPDDDSIMSALDENLSCLFKLTNINFHKENTINLVSSSVIDVLNTFLLIKLSYAHSSEDIEHFSDTFTISHISLVGYISRLNPNKASELFCLALETLRSQYSKMGKENNLKIIQIQESIWVVLKTIDAFIADVREGEDFSIPICFSNILWSQSHPVFKIITIIIEFMQEIIQDLSLASPAVVSALLEVLSTFITVYVVGHDEISLFFTNKNFVIISCVLYFLSVFSFDKEITVAGCQLLDVSVKSKGIISVLQSSDLLKRTEDLISCGKQFYGNTRGRISAFCIRSFPFELQLEKILQILKSFDIEISNSTSLDVDLCLERCASLEGFLFSLQDTGLLKLSSEVVINICDHIISVTSIRFYEKELTIRSTEMILQLFLSYSVILNGKELIGVIEKVCKTLNFVVKKLSDDSTWRTESAESEKHQLLKLLSILLCEISRWVMLECELSLDVVKSLSSCVISTLAIFLTLFDERSLSFPELQEKVFLTFQLCSESFTSDFVNYSSSQVFLSTLFFSLNSDSIEIQRVGITVTDTVVSFFRESGSQNFELLLSLLSAILQNFVSGKFSISLSSKIVGILTTLCSCLPLNSIEQKFEEILRLVLNTDIVLILQRIMFNVQQYLLCEVPSQRKLVLQTMNDEIYEGLYNIKGVLLV